MTIRTGLIGAACLTVSLAALGAAQAPSLSSQPDFPAWLEGVREFFDRMTS